MKNKKKKDLVGRIFGGHSLRQDIDAHNVKSLQNPLLS